MSRHKHIPCILVTIFVEIIIANTIDDLPLKTDECGTVCEESVLFLPVVKDSNSICQRGCRLFNIIDAKGDINLNKTKHDCLSSCSEAYDAFDFEACKYGCDEMLKKKESDISAGFIVYIEKGDNNIMVLQPELEQVDMDILSDPGLKGQLDFGYSIEYKIPETRVRTMPINSPTDNFGLPGDLTVKPYQPAGDWLDCASRNSGIPRWALVAAILMAVLLGIWLIFASEKRDHLALSDNIDSDLLVSNMEYVSPPPKYSLESEKI